MLILNFIRESALGGGGAIGPVAPVSTPAWKCSTQHSCAVFKLSSLLPNKNSHLGKTINFR